VETPTGPPEKRSHQRLEHRAVEPVQAQVVDVVERQRGLGDRPGDPPSASTSA
jgi:hypothetical protein